VKKEEWESYVEKSPFSSFYHKIEWKRIFEKSFRHKSYYLVARKGQDVVGVLPVIHIRSMVFGSIFCSMPFLNYGGVCADDEEAEKALFSEAEGILKSKKGDYLELRHIRKSSLAYPAKTHKVSMTLELDPDPEILWSRFKTKHRQTIRKAAKNGLKVNFGGKELLQDFYPIISRGWRDLGTPIYSQSFFENILDVLGDSVEICVVSYRETVIGTAFVGLFKKTVEGMWLSYLREFTRLQTNYFQYWEMIKRACEQGYEEFHLGRSSAEGGGEFFKEKWNAIPRQLYWEYVLNKSAKIPELNVDNPKYRWAMKVWRNLPFSVTQLIGPFLARNIP
jgi:FemAB-related protein (PEP-CTERM system-associated)